MPARGPMSNLHLDILKGTDEYLETKDLFVQGMSIPMHTTILSLEREIEQLLTTVLVLWICRLTSYATWYSSWNGTQAQDVRRLSSMEGLCTTRYCSIRGSGCSFFLSKQQTQTALYTPPLRLCHLNPLRALIEYGLTGTTSEIETEYFGHDEERMGFLN